MKSKRHIVIPLLLLLYFAAMTAVFGKDLVASGQYMRLFTISGVELIIIVALFFVMRKRNQLREQRERLSK